MCTTEMQQQDFEICSFPTLSIAAMIVTHMTLFTNYSPSAAKHSVKVK